MAKKFTIKKHRLRARAKRRRWALKTNPQVFGVKKTWALKNQPIIDSLNEKVKAAAAANE